MPTHPLQIAVTVYGADNQLLNEANVVAVVNSASVSGTTESGKVILNLGDISWSVGDSVYITASKGGKGTKSVSQSLTGEPMSIDITLEETSDITYVPMPGDQYLLNLAILASFDGELITHANPLPIEESKSPKDIRYDADDSAPNYIGLNYDTANAETSLSTWRVIKYTYSGANATRIQIRDNVKWDDRSSLF